MQRKSLGRNSLKNKIKTKQKTTSFQILSAVRKLKKDGRPFLPKLFLDQALTVGTCCHKHLKHQEHYSVKIYQKCCQASFIIKLVSDLNKDWFFHTPLSLKCASQGVLSSFQCSWVNRHIFKIREVTRTYF